MRTSHGWPSSAGLVHFCDDVEALPAIRIVAPEFVDYCTHTLILPPPGPCGYFREYAYNELPPATTTYSLPFSSYAMGAFWTLPMGLCHNVAPSLVRKAITLPATSPLKVMPDSVVNTPAVPAPSPMG